MNDNEVITPTADPLPTDAYCEPADSPAPVPEVSASDRAGAAELGPKPPVPEHANGAPVDAAPVDAAPADAAEVDGVVSDDSAVSGDVDSSLDDAPEVDEPVSDAHDSEDLDPDNVEEVDDSISEAPASEDADHSCDDDTEFDDPVPEASVSGDADDADSEPDDVRRHLVAQFEVWLDRMAEGEPPPEGLPEELLADALETSEPNDALGSDLYTLFAGLTKLSGEIGLQGRAFRQLSEVLANTTQVPARLDRVEAAQNAVARELARRSEPDKAELPAAEDILSVLFDLYDRLNRGLQNFDASYEAVKSSIGSGGFLQRLRGKKANSDQLAAPAAAMREGYRLTLSRLEAALLQWGIQRTGEVGEPFDPQRMAVVDVAVATAQAPDGAILEVYRSGYVVNGRVLATARVKVAKAGKVQ